MSEKGTRTSSSTASMLPGLPCAGGGEFVPAACASGSAAITDGPTISTRVESVWVSVCLSVDLLSWHNRAEKMIVVGHQEPGEAVLEGSK